MSSVSLSFSRKRVHSPVFRDSSSSSDSEDEAPPVKIKRKSAGTSFSFSSVLGIPVAITARLKNLVVWMSALPVKEYFQMAIKAGATLPAETIVIDDDDEVCIEEDDVIPETENPFIQRLQQSQKLMVSDKCFNRQIETNGSCSTRSRTRNALGYTSDPRFDTYASANGMNSKNWDPRRNGNGSYNFRQQRTDTLKRPAVVSNPETDIEILLETKPEVATLDGDEIEILSESPNIKQKPRSFQRINRHCTRAGMVKSSASHQSASQSEQSAVTRSQSSKSKHYTAHEVVRLQEKAQYKLLLDKYISGNHYTPIAKKSASNPDHEIDSSLGLSGKHFKKEVLQQPVAEFIEKYYKPCRLLPSDKTLQSSEKKKESDEVAAKEDDDDNSDDDDEIQIIDVKLPKYKPRYRQRPDFFSSDWIAELRNTVNAQTEERLKIVHEQEEVIERIKKERLFRSLCLDSQAAEASEPEFPELTPEMEEEVDKALHGGKPDERLCKITSDYLLRKDIETLEGLSWLNDLVINSYFDIIVERSKQEGYPSVYAYNTFFYSTYKAKGYQSVRRWTRKIDIFSYDLNFVPLHLGVHWCLAVIDHRSKKICYYDSMGNEEEMCLDLLHEYLCLEYRDKKGEMLDPSLYITEVMKDIPLQMNGSDCGMFTLKYAEYISRDAEITFAQSHMGYFRRRMVYELLHTQLL